DWGGGVGGVLFTIRSGQRSYNAYNSRGDVVSTSGDSGTATWQTTYEAFGTRTAEDGSNAGRQRANTKDEDPTGLLNEGHRYRDLEAGVFISRDPAGFVDGPNVYAYVRQNPWSAFDPEGLFMQSFGDWAAEKFGAPPAPVAFMAKHSGKVTGTVHAINGAASFVPVLGKVADGLDAAVLAAEGDYTGAAVTAGGGKAGQLAAKGFKAASTAVKIASHAEDTAKALKVAATSADAAKTARNVTEESANLAETLSSGGQGLGFSYKQAANNTVRQFGGLKFRAVRDLGHVDDATLKAMQKHGFAAKTKNGDPIVLHHHQQNPAGPIIEMPAPNHSIGNTKQHPFGNQKGMGLTPEQRDAFNKTRVEYWKQRATDELNRRGN
ncbi:hypothetical protein OJ996_25185, partial [Luteolibacter sp. GHJ8]